MKKKYKKTSDFSKQRFHPLTKKVSLLARNFSFLKRKKSKIPQDIIGNIALLKFPKGTFLLTKKFRARKFLKQHPNITTVLEKTDKFSGQLRKLKTKHLAGIKTKKAIYRENDCTFHFNVDESYFSPRLSNERKVIAEQVAELIPKKSKTKTNTPIKIPHILVMFAGIGPYPITIAKKLKQEKKIAKIYSNELNPEANKDAKENIQINSIQNYIELIPGDANKLPQLLANLNKSSSKTKNQKPITNFDIILMPRPNLKDTFLKSALKLSKSGTTIFYHGFGTKEEVLKEIKKDTIGKIGKISIRKAGDIGPYIFRWQAIFKIK